jgi:hypothetical protein
MAKSAEARKLLAEFASYLAASSARRGETLSFTRVGVMAPRTVVTVTTSTTVGANANSDYLVLIGASGAPTLPTAVANTNRYTFKNIDSSSHTISTTSSQTIDGSTTDTVTAGSSTEVISDGANWRSV